MPFIIVLVLSTLLIAASAAFFSVYGLAQVFTGAFVSVIIMGVALESGKLVAASFLYRFWNKISKVLKVYLVTAVVILMCITSMGISGYLTAAYQTDTIGLRSSANTLTAYKTELDTLTTRKTEMDQQVAQLPQNFVSGRQKLMREFKPEYERINPRIEQLRKDITELETQKITSEAKVGPIVFISKVLGSETDDAIFWLVVLIVCVFDPLAVALTIATNIAIADYKSNSKKKSILEPNPNTEEPAKTEIDSVIESARKQAILERYHQKT